MQYSETTITDSAPKPTLNNITKVCLALVLTMAVLLVASATFMTADRIVRQLTQPAHITTAP